MSKGSKTQRTAFKSLVNMAWRNIKAYGWINFKMCFVFAVLAFLVCLFSAYNAAISTHRAQTLEYGSSANIIMTRGKPNAKQQAILDEYYPDVAPKTYRVYSPFDRIEAAQGVKPTTTTPNFFEIEFGGKVLTTNSVQSCAAFFEGDVFTENDYIELEKRFNVTSPVMGRLPESTDEAVFPAPLLKAFGIDAQSAVGEEIVMYIKGESTPYFAGTITGIIIDEFFELIVQDLSFCPGILLCEGHPQFGQGYYRYIYSLNEWPDHDTANVFGEAELSYLGEEIVDNLFMLDVIQTLANELYVMIGSGLAVGLILTILLMIGKYVKVFARLGGVLLTFGLERKQLYGLLFIQVMILCLFAIPLSVVLTAASYSIINLLINMVMGIDMGISLIRIAGMLAMGIGAVFIVAVIFFGLAAFRLRKKTVIQFLRTEVV